MAVNNLEAGNFETIIWDLDGTLINSFEIFCEVLEETARRNKLAVPDKSAMFHNFHGSLEDSIKHSLGLSDHEPMGALVVDFLKVQEKYYEHPDDHLFADALGLAKRAHSAGLRQILVTNRAHADRGNASPRHIVENTQLKGMIGTIVCADEVAFRKPDARVLDGVEFSVSGTLVIGDQFVDAELAHNLGVHAVIADRIGQGIAHIDTLPDAANFSVVKSLDEVMV